MKDYLKDFINRLTNDDVNSLMELDLYRTMFKILIEKAPVGIYVIEDETYSYVNTCYSNLLGYQKEEMTQGKIQVEKTIHPDDLPIIKSNIEKRSLGDDKELRYTIRKIKKDGSVIYTEIHSAATIMFGKAILFGSVIDITDQVLAERKLQESNEQYKSLFFNSPDAIYSFDDEGRFLSVNPAGELITGYTRDELMQMPFMPLICPDDLPVAVKHFDEAKQGIANSANMVITNKDGRLIHINATHFPMKVDGKIVGTYGAARDISQKILYDQQLQQLAYYDPLTKLPNRKLFEDRLDQIIHLSRENGQQFAVFFLDFDRFKFINDSLGHHMGDELLKMVSERLQQNLRKIDTLSRLAGDEFTILFPNTSLDEAERLADTINQVMSDPFYVGNHSVTVSASIGIAFSSGEHSVHELIRNADTAMYHTKKYRRNSYTIYSNELDLKASYKLRIERDLKSAIDNNEMELFYQPIRDLKTDQLLCMEVLIRWHHPELGLISPGDFISISEENGQIIPIGTWVLKTACRQNRMWQDTGIPPFKVAINVSTKQLQQYNFVEGVIQILKETNLDAKWLELEITESILLDDVDLIKESLQKLKQAGISISIDDFGTGYTSLNYLRQYPFDKVKIDRSFIEDISRDLNGKRITSAIISLAHSLNMNVVAEGIENEIQLKYLIEENCDEGQGYLFSRPQPPRNIEFK